MKINILKEVTSKKQKRYMCAMKDKSAKQRPKGLSKAEASEMCGSKVHEECGIPRDADLPMGKIKINIIKIMKEQDDDLYIGGSFDFLPSKEEIRKKVVEDLGFLQVKQIGKGKFGTVFRATEGKGKYRDAAVKVLDKDGPHAKKEVKNYLKVDDARRQNKYIARHFPEVYDIVETNDHALIVMELLDPTSAGMSVVGDFLRGPEGVHRVGRPDRSMKDIDAMYRQRYGDEGRLMKTDVSGRVKNMLIDPKVLEEIIFQFVHEFPLDGDVLKKITKNVLGSSKGVLNAKPEEAQRRAYELEDTLLQFDAIKPNTLAVIMEDLESDMALIWLIMIMIKETYTNVQDKEHFSERVGYGINNLILKIRQTSAVNVVYDNSYSAGQIKDAEPGAASLMMAINALINEFGITPHDVHDKNALVRTDTGDIVIVDLGNFKEGGPLPPPLNENRRIVKVSVDKKR